MYVESRKQINGFTRVNEPAKCIKCCAIAVRSWKVAGSKPGKLQTTFKQKGFAQTLFLYQKPFTPDSFYTRHILHQHPLTHETLQKQSLHQTASTPEAFYTKHLSHQTSFDTSHFSTALNAWQFQGVRCLRPGPEK